MDSEKMMPFPAESAEKVERLLDVLEEMTMHPALKGRFAMYGGTAINLFMLDIPRLSVDIDATFIGSPEREIMLAAKPGIERAIGEVALALGYSIEPGKAEHAGRSFFLGYRGPHGADNIKIDFTYLNRVPLFPVEDRTTSLREGLTVPMLSDYELVGGKVKAFFSRIKVRDIYDVSNLAVLLRRIDDPAKRELMHKTILFNATLSAAFPFGFEGREQRFADKEKELEDELYPMLRLGEAKPSLESLMDSASAFIEDWVVPQDEEERGFLRCFADGDYSPELLFGEDAVVKTAKMSPEALWKLSNIKRMPK